MLQPIFEGMLLISQRMIYDHLVSNELSPQSITLTKELRDSVRKSCSRQRIDLAERKASDTRARKAEALTKDINESKSKKAILQKMQETLKSDSESLMLKAAEVFRRAHAYAIEPMLMLMLNKKYNGWMQTECCSNMCVCVSCVFVEFVYVCVFVVMWCL